MAVKSNTPNILLLTDDTLQDENLPVRLAEAGYNCHCVRAVDMDFAFPERYQAIELMILASAAIYGAELERFLADIDGYLPVIVIASAIDDDLLDVYQNVNVDGYIAAPINFRLLETKIRSALRISQRYRQRTEQRNLLLEYWQKVDLEQEVAAKIYTAVLQSNFLQTKAVRFAMSPMSLFNGDLLLVEKTPDNHLYLILGDFTGHGLSASVGATPVADIFYGMARKGFALLDILQEINAKLYKVLPTHMFLAATAVALYPDSKTLSLISCGLPEHFIVNIADGSYETVSAQNVPLGVLDRVELDVKNVTVHASHRLYLMTDGVFEAENPRGEAFGKGRILSAITENLGDGIAELQARLAEHTQNSKQKDDISLVELICDVQAISSQAETKPQVTYQAPALHWKSAMEFDIDALRVVNPVPVIVNALMEIQGLQHYRQSIFLIISELFANALDHGLLTLDSTIKASPEGFIQFYRLKEERLNHCPSGRIRLFLRHSATERGGRLTIKVNDSGDGFDWKVKRQQLATNDGYSGRGLKLVESLCSSLIHHGKGNRVTAVFEWQT